MLSTSKWVTIVLSLCLWIPSQAQHHVDSADIKDLPSNPFLPDPLLMDNGGKQIQITTQRQWDTQAERIKADYAYWVSGTVPPPPKGFEAKILRDTIADGVTLRTVELRFGPQHAAKMTVELMIPPSATAMPVFMTQWNHRGWAQIAVRRGYIGCVYAGADSKDDTKNYNEVFTGFDFATLMKRAWGASRVIDYLYTLPQVDKAKIGITGHSRNGKQSLMAAAFDKRIGAVVSSSGGTGGESTFRFSDERFNSEPLESITRVFPHWFTPRLRWFMDREDKLPVDQNSLMALIAPRGLMLYSANTEIQGNPWGISQSYKSVKKVYHFLHADTAIAIHLREGRHQHAARDVENFVDFFDYIFKRSSIAPKNKLYTSYTFDHWKQQSGMQIDPLHFAIDGRLRSIQHAKQQAIPALQDSIRKDIRWLLGKEPKGIHVEKPLSAQLTRNRTYPNDYLDEVIGEPSLPEGVQKMTIGPYSALGEDLWGSIYFPKGAVSDSKVSAKLPLVIYLHAYSYATGYHSRSKQAIKQFTDQGFAVLAFDMVGFGSRIEEAYHFYDRYPQWSRMGKMVTDTRNIIHDVYTRMPFIDRENVFLCGYSLGGTVALFTAALDQRVKGVAVMSAFSSFRHDNEVAEGIQHFVQLHGLLPQLGYFAGNEERIPVDFPELLTAIAPRPLLIIAPKDDRHHSASVVGQTVSEATQVYKQLEADKKVVFKQPLSAHSPDPYYGEIAAWMRENLND